MNSKVIFSKKRVLYVITLISLVLAYLNIISPIYKQKIFLYQDSIKSFLNDIKFRESFTGKNIEEIVNIGKEKLLFVNNSQ